MIAVGGGSVQGWFVLSKNPVPHLKFEMWDTHAFTAPAVGGLRLAWQVVWPLVYLGLQVNLCLNVHFSSPM
jgi:hypothetical protein